MTWEEFFKIKNFFVVDNRLEDLWRRENPDSFEFTHYDRSSCKTHRIDRVFIDIKIGINTKINHIMVSFTTDDYNAIRIGRFSSKAKIGKGS